MSDKRQFQLLAILGILTAMLLATAVYVGAFFTLSRHGVTADRNGNRLRVRIFEDHKWLCTVFRPLVEVESMLVEDTAMCYQDDTMR